MGRKFTRAQEYEIAHDPRSLAATAAAWGIARSTVSKLRATHRSGLYPQAPEPEPEPVSGGGTTFGRPKSTYPDGRVITLAEWRQEVPTRESGCA